MVGLDGWVGWLDGWVVGWLSNILLGKNVIETKQDTVNAPMHHLANEIGVHIFTLTHTCIHSRTLANN